MNREQLEKICGKIDEIRKLLKEDESGCWSIKQCLDSLEEVAKKELKEIVWREYLARRT